MKKIGIITLIGFDNYGNRLQNYAVEKLVESFEYQPETLNIIIDRKKPTYMDLIIGAFKHPVKALKSSFKLFKHKKIKSNKYYKSKVNRFKEFAIKHHSIKTIKYNQIQVADYAYFFVGSDQVWNPSFGLDSKIGYLTFAEKKQKVSLSASFGVGDSSLITDINVGDYLKDFKKISVREEAASMMVKKLSGRDSTLLVDPTMALDNNTWIELATPHIKKPNQKYILTYFLGDLSKEIKKIINEISKENNMVIVGLGDIHQPKYYDVDPAEFVDYFKDASLIFTDSFHGGVFSILFENPFVIFNRGNMNSRIKTLLSNFNLEERHWNYIKTTKNFFNIDYSKIREIKKYQKEKVFNFIEEALLKEKE